MPSCEFQKTIHRTYPRKMRFDQSKWLGNKNASFGALMQFRRRTPRYQVTRVYASLVFKFSMLQRLEWLLIHALDRQSENRASICESTYWLAQPATPLSYSISFYKPYAMGISWRKDVDIGSLSFHFASPAPQGRGLQPAATLIGAFERWRHWL